MEAKDIPDVQLKELIDTIQRDGVDRVRLESETLLQQARAQADGIVAAARAQAEALLANARNEQERLERSGREALKQASRDLLLGVRKRLEGLFSALLKEKSRDALGDKAITAAIVAMIANWTPERQDKIEILLPKERFDPLVIATFHYPSDLKPNSAPRYFNKVNKDFYRNVAHIHCSSRFVADLLRKYKYKSRLHAVSRGVDDTFCFMDIEKPKEWKDKFVIAVAGRACREQRHDIIIKAALQTKYSDKIQLVFTGESAGCNRYQKLSGKLKNPPVFVDYDKALLAQLFNQCDLYINAAKADNDPSACIEAFSCGLVPIISDSKNNAALEFAACERNQFKNADAADLAKKIEFMFERPEERIALREQYLKKAAKYTVSNGFSYMEYIYDQIVAEKALREKHANGTDAHKINLPQTMYFKMGEDYQFVNRNPFFLVFAFLFKYLIIYPIFYVITKLMLGFKAYGRKNLRRVKGGAITVSNHVHILDAPMLNFSLFPRQPVMTSIKGNFETPGVAFLVRTLGAVPIPETPKAFRAFMNAMSVEVSKNRFVHFYPEAALWPGYTELRPFKNGAFHLAVESGKPVIPIVIKQRPPGRFLKLFKKKPCVSVIIGEPVLLPKEGSKKERMEHLRDTVHQAMQDMLHAGAAVPDVNEDEDRASA